MNIFENVEFLNENKIVNQEDIYYNKDKFDSGEINLCFITGLSGSGKSTMGRNISGDKIEHYELDDVISNWNFSDSNLKEYGDLIYSFFKGPGKRFRYTSKKDWDNDSSWDNKDEYVDGYEVLLTKSFIKYAISYAKSHKNIKFVLDGIWIFHFIEPKELDNYAVYIKGTSMLISKIRAAKRDSSDAGKGIKRIRAFSKHMSNNWDKYYIDENKVKKYKDYFSKLIKKRD